MKVAEKIAAKNFELQSCLEDIMDKYLVKAQHYDMAVGLEVWLVREVSGDALVLGGDVLVTLDPEKLDPKDGCLRMIYKSKLTKELG